MDDAKRRELKEQEERDAYCELDPLEQQAIRFLLDCAASRRGCEPVRYNEWIESDKNNQWSNIWEVAQRLAAYDVLGMVPRAKAALADARGWSSGRLNATIFYGDAATIAQFCIRNGFIKTFEAFEFLFVRMFGGAVRPLTPSLFAAALLHPNCSPHASIAKELEKAMDAHESGSGFCDPIWFPNHPVPPLQAT